MRTWKIGLPKRWSDVIRNYTEEKQVQIEEAQDRRTWITKIRCANQIEKTVKKKTHNYHETRHQRTSEWGKYRGYRMILNTTRRRKLHFSIIMFQHNYSEYSTNVFFLFLYHHFYLRIKLPLHHFLCTLPSHEGLRARVV